MAAQGTLQTNFPGNNLTGENSKQNNHVVSREQSLEIVLRAYSQMRKQDHLKLDK